VKSTGPMMLGPIELDPTTNPRPREAHKGRFDHLIVIYEMIVIGSIERHLNSTTEFRQDHDFQILVLKENSIVGAVFLLTRNRFDHRKRVHGTAAALVDAFLQEERMRLGSASLVGGNKDLLPPGAYRGVLANLSHMLCSW